MASQAYGIDRECIIGIACSKYGKESGEKEHAYPYRSSLLFLQDRVIMFHKPESTEHEYYNMDDLDIIQKCSKTCMYNEIRENYEDVFQGLKFLKISKEDLAKLCKDLDKAKGAKVKDDKSVKETHQMLIDKLAEMEKTIQALEKRISKLEAKE